MQTLKHTSIAMDGDLVESAEPERRRRTTMGLTVARHTNILALAAALLLALGALAAATALRLQPASTEVRAPAPIAVAAPYTGPCRSDVAGCVPDEVFTIPASVPAAVAAPHTGTCRSDVAGCVPEEQIVPGVPTSPSYTYPAVYGDDEGVTPGGVVSPPLTGARVQQELYATEVRDNGQGTPGGTSGPCPPPQLCDR